MSTPSTVVDRVTEQRKPAQAQRPKNRRRRKFIWPELQVKVAAQTLFVALPILLLNFLLFYAHAVTYANSLFPPADREVYNLIHILFRDFVIVCVLAVPFSVGVGILYSFPFCGPIYRFNHYLRSLLTGRWDQKCVLRKGDHLQEVKDSVNAAVQTMADQVYRHYQLLGEIREVLRSPTPEEKRVAELLKEIEGERAAVAPRFGETAD